MITVRRLAFLLAAPLAAGSCAEMYAQRAVGVGSIEFSDNCAAGPYCVSGEVTAQSGAPLAGVRCVAEWFDQEPTLVLSDRRGLFAMMGLHALPRKLRFEKDGFETQPVSVVAELRRRAGGGDAAPAPVAAQEVGAAPSSASGAEGSGASAPDAGVSTRALIGDDLKVNDVDMRPDELFDFGNGSTIRVFVTMRRQ
jgi:hypothetical protein